MEARLAQAGRLSSICSERFPIIPDTIYTKDSVIVIDTFLASEYITDTIRLNDTTYIAEYKPVVIHKTKTLTKVVQVEDRAKIESLTARITQLEANRATLSAQITEWKDKAKTRLNWLILLLCGVFGFAIRKPVMKFIEWHFSAMLK